MKSKSFGIFLRITVSLAALGLMIYLLRGKLTEAIHILQSEIYWNFFWAGVAAYFIALIILAQRLQLIFKAEGIKLSYQEIFYLNWVGLFFNFFFPSAVGGDIMKIYYSYKHSGKKIASTTSVILDRLFGFITMMSMAVIAVSLYGHQLQIPQMRPLIFTFLTIMFFCVLFFFSKKFANSFRVLKRIIPSNSKSAVSEIYHTIYSYKKKSSTLIFCLALSVVAQFFFISMHYLLTHALGIQLSFGLFFILVPIIGIVSMAPSLGGLGVREAGAVYFFSRFMPSERALALSLLMDLVIYGYSVAGGLIYACFGGIKQPNLKEMEQLNAT